jgi:restriction system protein
MSAFIVFIFCFVVSLFLILKFKRERDETIASISNLASTNEEVKKTLQIGLYHRFKADEENLMAGGETPLDFERFVAAIMSDYNDSFANVTPASHDYGVDIEETRENKLFLGQVKCYAPHNSVGFEPIAIIHSQMQKQEAAGGYVVTTSSFTNNAFRYNEELNIDLIDGRSLIDIWMYNLENQKQSYVNLKEKHSKEIIESKVVTK